MDGPAHLAWRRVIVHNPRLERKLMKRFEGCGYSPTFVFEVLDAIIDSGYHIVSTPELRIEEPELDDWRTLNHTPTVLRLAMSVDESLLESRSLIPARQWGEVEWREMEWVTEKMARKLSYALIKHMMDPDSQ